MNTATEAEESVFDWIWTGQCAKVKEILANKSVNVNYLEYDEHNWRAWGFLSQAATRGCKTCVSHLIKAKAALEWPAPNPRVFPLNIAARRGFREIVFLLMDEGVCHFSPRPRLFPLTYEFYRIALARCRMAQRCVSRIFVRFHPMFRDVVSIINAYIWKTRRRGVWANPEDFDADLFE